MFELSKQLRAAVQLIGDRQSDIARGAGIQPATLSRFLSGQSGLSSDSIDRLCKYLGIVVVSLREWQRRDRVYKSWRAGTLQPVTRGTSSASIGGKDGNAR